MEVPHFRTLSVIVPAYNEAATISELLVRIRAADVGLLQKEIIIVDDGSTDGTRELLKELRDARVVLHEKNLGKGGALKTGIEASTGDLVIFQDADLEYDPADYSAMIRPIIEGTAVWANGVRVLQDRNFLHGLGNKMITWTTNFLFRHDAGEYEGCYKAFPRSLLGSIRVSTNNFDFDNELVCKLLKRGIKPTDVPIRYTPRDYEAGKHINWRHGFLILWTIMKVRFSR